MFPAIRRRCSVLSGATNSSKRLALTLGFPVPARPLDVVQAYRDRMKTHQPIPPRVVGSGPVLENIDRDEQVDLLKFPVPLLHELDGGRYIGTDDLVIMRDPENDWVNAATYRVHGRTKNTRRPVDVARQARAPDSRKIFPRGKPARCSSVAATIRCCFSPAATNSSSASPNTTTPAAIAACRSK